MDQLHDQVLKQYISSMAINSNMLKHTSDNYYIYKNDHGSNLQSPKTLSLFLTRLPQATSNYVHVLRCSICDYLTLNQSNFKEHFRCKHPNSHGFWTYSCLHCSGMSTEKALMEEHLKIYHRTSESPTGKLIERFHDPGALECISSVTNPLTLTSAQTNLAPSSGLTSILIPANSQMTVGKTQFNTTTINTTTTATIPHTASSPSPLDKPHETDDDEGGVVKVDVTDGKMGDSYLIGNSHMTSANGVLVSGGSSVSGSRRRKATTPGRICPQTSSEASVCEHSDLEEEVRFVVADTQQTKSDESGMDTSLSDSEPSVAIKRPGSCSVVGSVDEDEGISVLCQPSAKRLCTTDSLKSHTTQPTVERLADKTVSTSAIPFILSITHGADAKSSGQNTSLNKTTSSNITMGSQHLGALSASNSVTGQLIPISGLPDQLLCGISNAALLGGTTGHTNPFLPSSVNSTGATFALPLLDTSQGAAGSTSAWLLTNQPNSLSTNLNTNPAAMTTFQPTLLVPIPTAMGDSTAVHGAKSLSTSSIESSSFDSANGNASSVVRLSDLLEALKSLTSGGGVISSVGLPVNGQQTSSAVPMSFPTSSGLVTANVSTTSTTTTTSVNSFQHHHLSTMDSHTPVPTLPITGCNSIPGVVSTSNFTNANPTAQPHGTNSNSNAVSTNVLLNQLILAAVAAANSSSDEGSTTGIPSHSMIGGRQSEGVPHEQALDMSVRSGITPTSLPVSRFETSNGETNLMESGVKKMDGPDSKPPLALPTSSMNSVHGVVEVLSAALKGGLKQRLPQSVDSCLSNVNPGLLQCLPITSGLAQVHSSVDVKTGMSTNSSAPKSQVSTTETDVTHGILKGSLMAPPSILLPFPFSLSDSATSVAVTGTNADFSSTKSTTSSLELGVGTTAMFTPNSQFVSLSQLQAIMAAVANSSSVSITGPIIAPAPMNSSGSATMSTSTNVANTTAAITTLPTPTFQTSPLISTNPVLLNAATVCNASFNIANPTGAATMVLPTGLGGMDDGMTLTSTAVAPITSPGPCSASTMSALGEMKHTSLGVGNEGLSPTNLISGSCTDSTTSPMNPPTIVSNPTLINLITTSRSQSATQTNTSLALSSAAAARLLTSLASFPTPPTTTVFPGVSGAATPGTVSTSALLHTNTNVLNLLDSPQALFAAAAAAAAASGNVNQIALANLRGSTVVNSNTSMQRAVSTNAPVISVLDPRNAIHLRIADNCNVSLSNPSTLLTSNDLASCLTSNITNGPPSFSQSGDGISTLRNTEQPSILRPESCRKAKEYDAECASSNESHNEDEWDSVQENPGAPQTSVYSGTLKTEPMTGSSGSSPSLNGLPSTLLPSTSRRAGGSSRSSIVGGSSRRSLNTVGDPLQPGRPHRQNFTPTQNRILTEWYQIHQAKPYPSTDDTKELAIVSGLSYSQVKKWFANKRARSSSSGLPKPTPPLAPDSSPDPSAAAAIVAAALAAAATSTTGTTENPDYTGSVHSYFVNPHSLGIITSNSNRIAVDMASLEGESEVKLPEIGQYHSSVLAKRSDVLHATDANAEGSETEIIEVELNSTVLQEDSSCTEMISESEECHLPVVCENDLPKPTAELCKNKSYSIGPTDTAASPPTLQVHIVSRIVSPKTQKPNLTDAYNEGQSPDQNASLDTVQTSENSCPLDDQPNGIDLLQSAIHTQKSKSLRSRCHLAC